MLMQMTIILIRGTVPSSRYLSAPAQHIEIITKNSSGPVSYPPPQGKHPSLRFGYCRVRGHGINRGPAQVEHDLAPGVNRSGALLKFEPVFRPLKERP